MRIGSSTDCSAVTTPVNIIQLNSDADEWYKTSPMKSSVVLIICLLFKEVSYMAE